MPVSNRVPSASDKKWIFLTQWRRLYPLEPDPIGGDGEWKFLEDRRFVFDWAWPIELVSAEVNGQAWGVKGGGRHGKDKDLEKLNLAQLEGWIVLQFTPKMLEELPDWCCAMVKKALDQRRKP